MALRSMDWYVVAGHVEGSTGAAFNPATDAHVRGGAVARVAAGHFTITLDEGADFTEVIFLVSPHGNANLKATTIDEPDDFLKHVFLFDNAGAPIDLDFDILGMRFAP